MLAPSNPALAALLNDEREALMRLRALLSRTDEDPQTLSRLDDILANLDALFLVVVVGEFNAGKSSVLNALFGEKIMEEGPIPTTAKVTVIRHGEARMDRQVSEYLVERRHPSPLLRTMNLVDTPGTNSIIREHETITENFIPRADLVLFITSFDRPLSESERTFLSFIRESWGKRLVFVVNKVDMARTEETLQQVLEHVASGCRDVLHFSPPIFPVSAEMAYQAKEMPAGPERDALWEKSRFGAFEAFVTEILGDTERLALKFNAPLDAGARLLEQVDKRMGAREQVLKEDEVNLRLLDQHMTAARAELADGYARRLTEVDNLFFQMEKRGIQFLDDTIRIAKLNMLRDRDLFKEEFGRQVIQDTDQQIEAQVTQAVDGLLKQALALWNKTLNEFADRVRRVAGPSDTQRGAFFYNREELFHGIMREAGRKIEMYNLREEARRILENARNAAAMFVGAEAVAVGIGAIATIVVSATALDVTGGFIAAGVLAVVGLIFLPRQKRRAIGEFKERVEALRADVRRALDEQLGGEVDTSLERVRDTIKPYTTFVRNERALVDAVRTESTALNDQFGVLRSRVRQEVGETRLPS
ncbi:MAG: dynamin family protein [Rhodothermales bacterium]